MFLNNRRHAIVYFTYTISISCEISSAKASGVGEKINILSNDLVATQNNVGWNGQPARALDGNTNGQWSSGCVKLMVTNSETSYRWYNHGNRRCIYIFYFCATACKAHRIQMISKYKLRIMYLSRLDKNLIVYVRLLGFIMKGHELKINTQFVKCHII